MASERHHVYLVPGFFGFANLGAFLYFSHLHTLVADSLFDAGIEAQVVRVHSHPTGSVPRRAERLLETIEATAGASGPIHLIGHSTGGLDARLLASPTLDIEPLVERRDEVVGRIRTITTVAAPHRGTPLAGYFAGPAGTRLVQLLSVATLYVLRFGHLPLSFVLRIGQMVTKATDVVGLGQSLLDQLYRDLLDDFHENRREQVEELFEEVREDHRLIGQLTPEKMVEFNRRIGDHPGIHYASVVTRARPPGTWGRFRSGPNPVHQVTYSVYHLLHRGSRLKKMPVLTPLEEARLVDLFGEMPDPRDSDGIVPTVSQPWGEILTAADGDHLDVIGHFNDKRHDPPHVDWLTTGSHFRRRHFEAVWKKVVDFIASQSPSSSRYR